MEPKPLAEWTVMVYMSGDNSLSAECVWALTEMKDAASSDKINVIAQFDPSDGLARTRRYEINKDGLHIHKQAAKQAGNRPKRLDEDVMDLAGWNPRTGEAYFKHESPQAEVLASKRIKERRVQDRISSIQIAKGQSVNAMLTPDDLGASPNDTDAASPVTLYNFLSFGVEFYPARHYMIVLSGHSAGIQPTYLLKDDSSGGYMTFRQLKSVFFQLRKWDLADEKHQDGRAKTIDILGFDTCLMSMAEICYELRGLVKSVIGSESYTPASGWPYQSIIDQLNPCVPAPGQPRGTTLSPRQLAASIVDNYVDYYDNYATAGVSVALSALDVTKSAGLVRVVKELATVLMRELKAEHPELNGKREKKIRPFTDALILAHWEAQSYNGEWYADLRDFCECLSNRCSQRGVRAACKGVITYLKDHFVIKSSVSGPTYQYSNGAAIYFPWAGVATYFWGFGFAKKSGWGDFLALYTNVTRRKFRVPDNPTTKQRKQVATLQRLGGNYLNYDRNLNRMSSDKMSSDKMLTFNTMYKMSSDKMTSDKMSSDKMSSDKMSSDKSGNPIHSMRNPPIVAI